MNILASAFPLLPECAATGAPLFLEPIAGSGERICVAVAARDSVGGCRVSPTVDKRLAKCMLGEQAEALLGFIEFGVASLEQHLGAGHPLDTWASPLHGMQLGPISKGRVVDLEMMQRTLARNHAFLASLENFAADAASQTANAPDDGAERWLRQVRDAVSQREPSLEERFSKKVQITDSGSETKFDFLGLRLAAQLGRLIPGSMSAQKNLAKAKLWDLENLRDSRHASAPSDPDGYELLLYRPRDDDPAYTERAVRKMHEVLADLEGAGNRQSLHVRPVFSADEAARRIVEIETRAA